MRKWIILMIILLILFILVVPGRTESNENQVKNSFRWKYPF